MTDSKTRPFGAVPRAEHALACTALRCSDAHSTCLYSVCERLSPALIQDKAFANNYRRPIIGYERDIRDLSRQDIAAFFARNYGPDSLSIAIVGDITASRAEQLARKYFGDWQNPQRTAAAAQQQLPQQTVALGGAALSSQANALQRTVAQTAAAPASGPQATAQMPPGQDGGAEMDSGVGNAAARGRQAAPSAPTARPANLAQESQITVPSQAGPAAHLVFYRPAAGPDGLPIAVEMVAELLSGSRSSRLYKSLVTTGAMCNCWIGQLTQGRC